MIPAEPPHYPFIRTSRLILRLAEESDAGEIVAYYARNEEHFSATSPTQPEGFLSEDFWRTHAHQARAGFERDDSVRLLLFGHEQAAPRIIGTASFTQIFRGPFQACYLGYSLDEDEQGKGLMTEALCAAIDYMFQVRNLHRVMANHLPENDRSARVLRRLGFEVEGMARSYLQIAGVWRDHVLNSKTNPDWRIR